jgi:transcriptional regulator with XRE-family HTH domain
MQITQAELERRLGSSKNLARTLPGEENPNSKFPESTVVYPEKGSPSPRLSTGLRIVAGSLSAQGEKTSEVASEFGITPSQVIAAKNSKDPKVSSGITRSIEKVQELAIDKMMLALGLMSADKMEGTPLKDLSIIAANMGRIIEKTRIHEEDERVQLIIYAPEPRTPRSYKYCDA